MAGQCSPSERARCRRFEVAPEGRCGSLRLSGGRAEPSDLDLLFVVGRPGDGGVPSIPGDDQASACRLQQGSRDPRPFRVAATGQGQSSVRNTGCGRAHGPGRGDPFVVEPEPPGELVRTLARKLGVELPANDTQPPSSPTPPRTRTRRRERPGDRIRPSGTLAPTEAALTLLSRQRQHREDHATEGVRRTGERGVSRLPLLWRPATSS